MIPVEYYVALSAILFTVGGVGFRYHFAPPRVAFVARVNWPVGLQVGLTF